MLKELLTCNTFFNNGECHTVSYSFSVMCQIVNTKFLVMGLTKNFK